MSDPIKKYKGVAEFEILGEVRGFKFGMGAMMRLCQLEGTNFKGVQEKLSQGDITVMVHLLYSAAVEYCKLYKKENEPSLAEVANWADELGDKLSEVLSMAFEQATDPNPTALQKEGQ